MKDDLVHKKFGEGSSISKISRVEAITIYIRGRFHNFCKRVKMQFPNIIFLRKVKTREQVQVFHTSNKNYYHFTTTTQVIIKSLWKEKKNRVGSII